MTDVRLLARDFKTAVEASRARMAHTREILNHLPGQHDQSSHGGDGAHGDDIAADEHGNTREGGRWFDEDGIYMTDSYVDTYGLPVTHAGFGDDRSGRYAVVLSTRGDIHVLRETDGGPSDALYSRDAGNVRLEGMSPAGARGLASDLRWASERTTSNRPSDPETGEDVAGDDFGVGHSRATGGITVTSASNGAVTVAGLGRNGSDQRLDEGDANQFAEALGMITEVA